MMVFARNNERSVYILIKAQMMELVSNSQKGCSHQIHNQIFLKTTFRNLFVVLNAFELLTVGFLFYHLHDDDSSLIEFLNREFCLAVMPDLKRACVLR